MFSGCLQGHCLSVLKPCRSHLVELLFLAMYKIVCPNFDSFPLVIFNRLTNIYNEEEEVAILE